jgi:putative transposase
MDQRKEFVLRAMESGNFRDLCREYGISAKTGYKWRERFLQYGLAGMGEHSRRPHGHADQLVESVVCEIVRLKQAHLHWGPLKIHQLYERKHGQDTPSLSSFKRVLERAGLVVERLRRRQVETGRIANGVKAEKPNDVWTADFKGWWKDRAGLRVEPLTVRDEYSRMVLDMRILDDARTESVRACFERLFTIYGIPRVIRSDNGSPFASSRALLGLSRLSVWWITLGIDLERSRPGCPQDNGAHERLHRDIRRELQAGRIGRDQHAFDIWRNEFNTERPHQALGMRMPGELYTVSERKYEGTPEDIEYGGMESRKVHETGYIDYEAQRYGLSASLAGWSVGLSPRVDGLIDVWFSKLLLGQIEPATASFKAARPGSLKAGQEPANKCNH